MDTRPTTELPFDLVVIAASVGGVQALGTLLSALPPDFPVPVAIVLHRTTQLPNLLADVLGRRTRLPVKMVEQLEPLRPGTVYLAPPDLHLTVRPGGTACLTDGRKIRFVRSSANPLFESAAESLGGQVLAVVLTGFGRDGTDGVQAVRARGGTVIAQDRATSEQYGMPQSAIATGCVSHVLPLREIGPALAELVRGRMSADQPRGVQAP
jgi:two-component system chemotaxis response regulator CheB